MEKTIRDFDVYRLGISGAVFIMIGTLFPSLFAIFLQPKQPAWQSAAVFVEHYHTAFQEKARIGDKFGQNPGCQT